MAFRTYRKGLAPAFQHKPLPIGAALEVLHPLHPMEYKLVFKVEVPGPSSDANGPLFQAKMFPWPDRLGSQLYYRHCSGLQPLSDVETNQSPVALAAVIKAALAVHTRSMGAVAAENSAAGTTGSEIGRQHHLLLQPPPKVYRVQNIFPFHCSFQLYQIKKRGLCF